MYSTLQELVLREAKMTAKAGRADDAVGNHYAHGIFPLLCCCHMQQRILDEEADGMCLGNLFGEDEEFEEGWLVLVHSLFFTLSSCFTPQALMMQRLLRKWLLLWRRWLLLWTPFSLTRHQQRIGNLTQHVLSLPPFLSLDLLMLTTTSACLLAGALKPARACEVCTYSNGALDPKCTVHVADCSSMN